MPTDPRIIGVEELDRHRTVLTDAHSLSRLYELTPPSHYFRGRTDVINQPSLANLIQNLVLYDVIVVDSVLLDTDPNVADAIDLFPDAIFGVYLKLGIRKEIGSRVESVTSGDRVSEPPTGIEPGFWAKWQQQDSSEKPLMDKMHNCVPALIPSSYANDDILKYAVNQELSADLPMCCLDSMNTLGRAHYYLELSSWLKIPLAADPIRSRYFEILFTRLKTKPDQGIPEQVITYFDQAVLGNDGSEIGRRFSVDLSLPPVAEYVANYAQLKGCALCDAVLEVRNSKNASRFREWCARLRSSIESGRSGTKDRQESLRELEAVCEKWKKDIKEGVKYRTRKLKLESLPWIGGLFKAINFEPEIPDPVIAVDRKTSYFLFLNDLLRPPQPSEP